MSYQIIFTDELYHHGIKGQKWGVRRFQNEDGSLTAAGKARYDYKEAEKSARRAKNAWGRASFASVVPGGGRLDKARQKNREYLDAVETSKEKRLKAKEERIKATKQAVKAYNKAYNKASSEADKADDYWRETQAQRKKLGKTRLTRMIRTIKNDTAEAKKYNKMYDEAMKKFDTVDELWAESNKKYRDTGKNRVAAILNTIKYS